VPGTRNEKNDKLLDKNSKKVKLTDGEKRLREENTFAILT